MKDKILKSNYYKNYKSQLIILLAAFLLITIIPILFALTMLLTDNPSGNDIIKLILILFLLPLILFSPGLIYFGYRMLYIKLNVNKFELKTGIIKDINTPLYVRSNYRNVSIRIENTHLNHTKVFKGQLYDDIYKGMEVEVVLYKNAVIII